MGKIGHNMPGVAPLNSFCKRLATICARYHILLGMIFLMVNQVHGKVKPPITVLANVLGCTMAQLMFKLRTKCYVFLMTVLTSKMKIRILAFHMKS